jgi:thiol-disulfide isomerase/thioredoxin
MTPQIRLLFIGLAALGAAVLGYYFYDRTANTPPESPALASSAGAAEAGAGVAVPAPGAASGPRIPEVRPEFTLKDPDGAPRSIREWDGRSLVVNFWATWCAPCRREIPLLNALQAEYAPQGFEVIGVAVDFHEDVVAFMAQVPIDYPVLIGEEDGLEAAEAFGVSTMAFPFTAFTDDQGRILTVHMGEIHEPEARAILGVVQQVNAGELAPAAARLAIRDALDALAEAPGAEPAAAT